MAGVLILLMILAIPLIGLPLVGLLWAYRQNVKQWKAGVKLMRIRDGLCTTCGHRLSGGVYPCVVCGQADAEALPGEGPRGFAVVMPRAPDPRASMPEGGDTD